MHKEFTASCIAPLLTWRFDYISEGTQIIENIVFSAPGKTKLKIEKNKEGVSTLFNTKYILNGSYPFKIKLNHGDNISFYIQNLEGIMMDMSINFEIVR